MQQTKSTQTPSTRAAPSRASQDILTALWSQDLPREHGFEPLEVEGRLPDDLRGTLYRNGPGLFGQFGQRYTHPFEADGALSAVRFEGGRVLGGARVTQSEGLREERAAGRLLYGLNLPWLTRVGNSLRGRAKNTANTNVIVWQGRLFALMEAGRPTEIDPHDLRTIGETDLGGVVQSMFSAHPHRVPARRTVYNFGLEYGKVTRLHLYALPDQGPARHLGALTLPGPPMLHDFIATETHLIFFLSPVRVNVPRMLLSLGSFTELFQWRPELGTEVICVPIDRVSEAVRFTVDPFYQWHFGNAFTRGEELVVDYVRHPNFNSFYLLGKLKDSSGKADLVQDRYHRAVLDLKRHTLRSEELLGKSCDFPRVHPELEGRPHRYTWLVLGALNEVGRLDTATGELVSHLLPEHQLASEPIFVPRAGSNDESDGHVLVLCQDGVKNCAFVAIYDGKRLSEGPCAKVWFDHFIPITFHGSWLPA